MEERDKPEEEGFESVKRRKKKRKGRPYVAQSISFDTRMKNIAQDLENTPWMAECQGKVRSCLEAMKWLSAEIQVLCLGLGSPMESRSSVAQLILLLSVCDDLKISHEKVTLFDPHFSQEDIQGLLDIGFCVPTENQRGKYTLEHRTLAFLPHCGIELYENLLRSNWTPDGLHRLLLFGNVLEDYATSKPVWKLEQHTPCLSRIWKHLHCDSITPVEAYPETFNNLALQFLRLDSPLGDEPHIWELPANNSEQESVEIA